MAGILFLKELLCLTPPPGRLSNCPLPVFLKSKKGARVRCRAHVTLLKIVNHETMPLGGYQTIVAPLGFVVVGNLGYIADLTPRLRITARSAVPFENVLQLRPLYHFFFEQQPS
jgi:hypothetical protein